MARAFSARGYTVVTKCTTTDDLRVIDAQRRNPRARDVAGFAHVGRVNVGVDFTAGVDPVMALGAITSDAGVVELGAKP